MVNQTDNFRTRFDLKTELQGQLRENIGFRFRFSAQFRTDSGGYGWHPSLHVTGAFETVTPHHTIGYLCGRCDGLPAPDRHAAIQCHFKGCAYLPETARQSGTAKAFLNLTMTRLAAANRRLLLLEGGEF